MALLTRTGVLAPEPGNAATKLAGSVALGLTTALVAPRTEMRLGAVGSTVAFNPRAFSSATIRAAITSAESVAAN